MTSDHLDDFVGGQEFQNITRSSATAEIARVTIRSVIAVDRLTLTVTLTYVNFISLIELLIRGILCLVMLRSGVS